MPIFRTSCWWLVGLFLVLAPVRGAAQRPRGQFLQDSVQIGKPLRYALSVRHRPDWDVFFPDSTFNFFPFELVERAYFPTQTDSRGSVDSVVYTLISFEIAPVQRLRLPVFVRSERDCTAVWSVPDSVRRRALLPDPAQASRLRTTRLRTTRLRADTRWQPVDEQFNYPLLLGILLGITAGAGLLYGAFGEPIRRWLRMLQLRRRYLEFSRNFQRLSRGMSGRKQDLARAERAVVLWKRYVERLERKPVTTFTTRELIDYFPDNPQLAEALRETDAVVYGGVFSPRTPPALQTLRELARQRYRQRRREIAQEGRVAPEVPVTVS